MGTLTVTTIPGQSGPGGNSNEDILHIPPSFRARRCIPHSPVLQS